MPLTEPPTEAPQAEVADFTSDSEVSESASASADSDSDEADVTLYPDPGSKKKHRGYISPVSAVPPPAVPSPGAVPPFLPPSPGAVTATSLSKRGKTLPIYEMAMEIERESVDDKAASRERQKKKRSSKDREVEAAEKIAREVKMLVIFPLYIHSSHTLI